MVLSYLPKMLFSSSEFSKSKLSSFLLVISVSLSKGVNSSSCSNKSSSSSDRCLSKFGDSGYGLLFVFQFEKRYCEFVGLICGSILVGFLFSFSILKLNRLN
jgi:hypothetical protein